jgi:hypothetical protein
MQHHRSVSATHFARARRRARLSRHGAGACAATQAPAQTPRHTVRRTLARARGLARTLCLAAIAALWWPVPVHAAELDLEAYGEALRKYTRCVEDVVGTQVRYTKIRQTPEWQRVMTSLAATDPAVLGAPAERMAFWINAYNILAIDLVAKSYPVKSIRDLGSLLRPVWGRDAGSIGGRAYSLEEIEHEILRKMGDPRIHAAIVCASTSCPSLSREPFRAAELEAQLDAAFRAFARNVRKGVRLDAERRTLHLSRIFDWFAEDFAPAGGVLAYLARYVDDDVRPALAKGGAGLSLEYMDYDWSVNAFGDDAGAQAQ